ncbi:hypothetical protein LUX29_13075 [Aureimonas altamirensis]|uniref:hypothetical protein n=1 Tax=Aureimonas altamirensis TaxID=370622 RepID=UPI001E43A78F|nr:hypothetical protein [Aureimonas altamirensis]UHD44010.1 hypothetical protein LUX29_13075 [Aureimonas altamirensis]
MVKKQHVAGQLARQFHKVSMAHLQADDARDDYAMAAHQGRMDAIREEVSWHQASCGAGALMQLGAAATIIDYATDRLEPREELALRRLFASLAGFVEANSNDRRSDFDRTYLGI